MATQTAPRARIARIQGKFLAPGVSANRRLYTKAAISNAVEAMAARIADPAGLPITMMAHHPTFPGGDSRAIVARVTKVGYDQATGIATYEADVPDTDDGRTLIGLTTAGEDGKRYLNNVSIRGAFVGPVETKVIDGQQVITCDDLVVNGIDFTQDPGVSETGITNVILEEAAREAGGNAPLVEAAPGSAELVTSADAALADLLAVLGEAYGCLTLDNGPADIRISGWGVSADELPALAQRLAAAGTAALAALDPDEDGDIDGLAAGEAAPASPTEAATASNTALAGKEPAVATENTPTEAAPATEAAAPARNLTDADIAALAEALKPAAADETAAAEAAPAADETAKPAAEATNTPADPAALVEAMKAQLRDELRQELIESGFRPDRKGLVRQVAETSEDMATKIREGKASRAEIDAYAAEAWGAVFSGRLG